MNKQLKQIKDQINEVNVQDVQLQAQAVNTLTKQVNPQFKGVIEEKDINNYQEMLDKIHTKLLDSLHFLPEQDRTVRQQPASAAPYSVGGYAASEPTAKSMSAAGIFTPSGAKISASPFATSAGSLKQGFQMPNMALMQQFGLQDVVSQVTKQANDTVSILGDREDFIMRERQRKEFMEQDKLTSMKKVMEYQQAVDDFPQ